MRDEYSLPPLALRNRSVITTGERMKQKVPKQIYQRIDLLLVVAVASSYLFVKGRKKVNGESFFYRRLLWKEREVSKNGSLSNFQRPRRRSRK